jgi:hypothetical protein
MRRFVIAVGSVGLSFGSDPLVKRQVSLHRG